MKPQAFPPILGALVALTVGPFASGPEAPGTLLAQVAPPAPPARGWIGVSFDIRTTGDGNSVRSSAVVTDVLPGSPAEVAGLRPGDLLVSINDRPWTTEIGRVTREIRAGDEVALVVVREGRRQELRLRAAARPVPVAPEPASWTFVLRSDSTVERMVKAMDSLRLRITTDPEIRIHLAHAEAVRDSVLRAVEMDRARIAVMRGGEPRVAPRGTGSDARVTLLRRLAGDSVVADSVLHAVQPFPRRPPEAPEPEVAVFRPLSFYALGENRAAGMEVVEVRPELAEYFGVGGGVLVVDVAPGTAAHRAGIQPGDVLTELDGSAVASVADLRRGLARASAEPRLRLVRKGQSLQVTLRN